MKNKLVIWEVLKLMAENPKKKAKCVGGTIEVKDGFVRWTDGLKLDIPYNSVNHWNVLMDKKWEIIEPPKKLKEMSFGEAMYEFHKNDELKHGDMKSSLTKNSYNGASCHTKEEFLGLWTVKGVYEDD